MSVLPDAPDSVSPCNLELSMLAAVVTHDPSVLPLQLRNITSFISRMLIMCQTYSYRAPSPAGMCSLLQPLLQLYLNWSTASIRLADGPQHASRQQCDQPAADAAADRAESHTSLSYALQLYCTLITSIPWRSMIPSAEAGVEAATLLSAAAKAQHWELAGAVAQLMCSSLEGAARKGNINEAQQGSAGSNDEDSKLRESASAACQVLMMIHSASDDRGASGDDANAQRGIDRCRIQLVHVLLHYGTVAGQELQHLLASTGMIKQLCGLLKLAAAEHQAAATQHQAGPSTSRQPASAQVSGIVTTIESIRHPAAQLLCDAGAMPLMEQLMQVGSQGWNTLA